MVKFKGRSALVIALLVAKIINIFLQKTVDLTSSTNFTHLFVPTATVVQTKSEAKNSTNTRTHKLILRYTYVRNFANSSLHDNHQFLLEIL